MVTKRIGRELDRSAVTALVPVLALIPFWLGAMLLLWLPIRLVVDIPWWWVPAGWLGLGAVLGIPPIQVAIFTPLLGARKLTHAESKIVTPIWQSVADAAGFRPRAYRLRVIDSPELNGYACGGHLIVLTTFALDCLTPDELAGVLAHEVSHHIGLHTVALTLSQWLSVPVYALARVGFWLNNVARAATEAFATDIAVLRALGNLVSFLLHIVARVFLLGLQATAMVNNLVSKQSEFDADLRAVRMGYGPQLISALRAVIRLGGGQRAVGWRQRVSTAHPAARTRVAQIDSLMTVPRVVEATRRERDIRSAEREAQRRAHLK